MLGYVPPQAQFEAQPLPYAYTKLAPAISEESLRFHHDKHYVGYVAKLNELVVDSPYAQMPLEDIVVSASGSIFNNAAQAWNHAFYFDQFAAAPQTAPDGALAEAIDKEFGSFAAFKAEFLKACAMLFGSGWVWLSEQKDGRLVITSEGNAGNPLRSGAKPLMTLDVWEHAYYIDYRNRRVDAVAAQFPLIDWRIIGERYNRK